MGLDYEAPGKDGSSKSSSSVYFEVCTSSVSPELLHGFARGLAPDAFLRNMTLLSINMKVIWRASLLKNCEQANQCNNSEETEETH